MGTTPFPGDGLQPHLAWLRDELGGAGTWLVETTTRMPSSLDRRHGQQLTTDLLATLEELTADVDDAWCSDGSLEVTGLQVGSWAVDHEDVPFLKLDTIDLSLADPNDPFNNTLEIAASRLPALYVAPLRRLVDRYWGEWDRTLISSVLGAWRRARDLEVGLSRHDPPGTHRRWARAGHTILTALADAYDAWAAHPAGLGDLRRDVHDQAETIGRRVLDEQQLAVAYGPLRRQPTPGGQR